MRLLFNDTVVFESFVSRKEVRNAYKGGGGCVFLLNITLIYPIFSLKKILFSYISFVKSGLTISFLFRIAYFSRLSLPSRNPKQQTVE
jgi:hypothetical protein